MATKRSVTKIRGIPRDEEFTTNLSKLVGHLVICWGLFEFGLTSVIATTYHQMGGNKIEPELPIKLSRCAKLIRKYARQIPALAEYRDELNWIASEALRIAPIRNDIVHGYVASYEEENNHLLIFAMATPDQKTKTIHRGTLRRITAEDLAKTGRAALDLSMRTANLSNRLMKATIP